MTIKLKLVCTCATLLINSVPLVAQAGDAQPKFNINKEALTRPGPAMINEKADVPEVERATSTNQMKPADDVKTKASKIPKPALGHEIKVPEMKTDARRSLPAVQQEKLTVPSDTIKKVPGRKLENANAVRQADQMRGVNDAQGAMEAMRNIPGAPTPGEDVNTDLGLGNKGGLSGPDGRALDPSKLPGHETGGLGGPAGSEYLPDLPSNQDKGPSNAALRPSSDLRGIMGGAASLHKETPPKTGRGIRTTLRDGTVVSDHIWQQDGEQRGQRDVHYPDGTSEQVRWRQTGNGTVTRTRVGYDENGRPTDLEESATLPEADPAGNPDPDRPNYSAEFARFASQFDHSKKKGAPIIDQVNPGPDGATPQPKAPQLRLPEDAIVVNPDPNNVSGEGRQMDPEVYRRALKDRVDPGGHPGNDPNDPPGGAPQ